MPWEVDYSAEEDLVEVVNTGVLTPEEMIAESKAAIELARQKGTKRYLVNGSQRERLEVFPHRFGELPKLYEKLGMEKDSKAAMVLPMKSDFDEGMSLFETVCKRSGYDVKIFQTREEAIGWLREEPQR